MKSVMSQPHKWMKKGKISKLVVVITNKDTGEIEERWQFDVQLFQTENGNRSTKNALDNENAVPG